ncbi:MAG: DUF4091 domain-containing protein [Candidatus Brocadiia bacterium]
MKVDIYDSLEWLFADSQPRRRPRGEISIETARRARPGFQILVNDVPDETPIHVEVPSLRSNDGEGLARCELYKLISVPVEENTGAIGFTNDGDKNEHVTRRAPFRVFDALKPVTSPVRAASGPTVLLVQFPIAPNAKSGSYSGMISVAAGDDSAEILVGLNVHEALVPARGELKMTNWFNTGNMAERHGLQPWSRGHWKMIRQYAELMARNRQNMFWVPLSLVDIEKTSGETWNFDFKRWMRLVRVFLDAGCEWIEGGHVAGRHEWDDTRYHLRAPGDILGTGAEGHLFLSQFLPALLDVIERNGWRDRYVQHVADEPHGDDVEDYRILCGIVRKFMPGVPLIDATCNTDVHGALDIYVPQDWKYEEELEEWSSYRESGDELWHYTCCFPGGPYLNRLLDQELLRPRLLHWGNYKYDLQGFLHWGLNQYRSDQDPFEKSVVGHGGGNKLPAGDTHIVYPGDDGPMSSMRFEAQREGVEDYELLRVLAGKNKKRSDQICRRVFRKFDDYTVNIKTFRGAHRDLLDAVDRL